MLMLGNHLLHVFDCIKVHVYNITIMRNLCIKKILIRMPGLGAISSGNFAWQNILTEQIVCTVKADIEYQMMIFE